MEGICLRTVWLALLTGILGLSRPAPLPAQIPYQGPTTGAPNAAANSFYNGGAPAATFQQRPAEAEQGTTKTDDQPVVTGEIFEPGEVLATVGDQFILAGDVLPHVNQVLEPYKGK